MSNQKITILQNRQERENRLREGPLSWVKLTGLTWLKQGANSFGSAPENDIVLPEHAPKKVGFFHYDGKRVTIETAKDVTLTCKEKPVTQQVLQSDMDEDPDYLELGTLTLLVIKRAERFLIRIWDQNAITHREFDGLKHYDYDPVFRVEARFIAYDTPKMLTIDDVIDIKHEIPFQGSVLFRLARQEHQLEAMIGDDYLFVNFRDTTNGDTTYPGGRFLIADLPKNGRVTLDFNDAYNPPCAYTEYATCPLPPLQNRLSIQIEAGEKLYQAHN